MPCSTHPILCLQAQDLPAAAALTLACCSWAAAVLGPALRAAAPPPAASALASSAPVPPHGSGNGGNSIGRRSSSSGVALDGVSLLGEAAKYLVVAMRVGGGGLRLYCGAEGGWRGMGTVYWP